MTIPPEDPRLKPNVDFKSAAARTPALVRPSPPEVAADSNDEYRIRADSLGAQKDLALFSAGVNAWINTRMEYDRTLVTLSAGGLGLFVTLITTVGVRHWTEVVCYALGAIGFLSAIGHGLAIFKRNADFLHEVLRSNAHQVEDDPLLAKWDKRLRWSFAVAALAAILAGASVAGVTYFESRNRATSGAKQMQESKKSDDIKPIARPQANPQKTSTKSFQKSLNGFQMVRPESGPSAIETKPNRQETENRSLLGFQNLRPSQPVLDVAPADASPPVMPTVAADTPTVATEATPLPSAKDPAPK